MQEILEVSCRPVHDGIWTPAELMGALERAHQLCGCPDPVVYGAAAYFQNLLHFVPPASLGGNTAQLQLRPSPDIFHRSIGSKSLRYCAAVGGFAALRMRHAPCGYTKYNCTFQTSPCQKISRHPLLLINSELPLIFRAPTRL